MTSKEIVKRTISFRDPPRMPVTIGNMELPTTRTCPARPD